MAFWISKSRNRREREDGQRALEHLVFRLPGAALNVWMPRNCSRGGAAAYSGRVSLGNADMDLRVERAGSTEGAFESIC
jgi:hypothetical protein